MQKHIETNVTVPATVKTFLKRIPVRKTVAVALLGAVIVGAGYAVKDQVDVDVDTSETPNA